MKRATRYTTGTGFNRMLVKTPDGKDFAWCGQSTGALDAKRIAKAMNSDARQRAEIRRLKERLGESEARRAALNDFVRGMADGYARAGKTAQEWIMRDVLAEVAALKPTKVTR